MISRKFPARLCLASAIASVALGLPAADAAILGTYDFNTSNNAVLGTGLTHLSFSTFSRTGTNAASASGMFASDGWTTASSLDSGKYVGFTAAANDGYRLTLDKITFDYRRVEQGSDKSMMNMQVQYATSGTPVQNGSSSTYTAPNNVLNSGIVYNPVDFSTVAGGSATFRFHAWNASRSNTALHLDNVKLEGTLTALARMNIATTSAPAARILRNTTGAVNFALTNTDVRAANELQDALTYSLNYSGAFSGSRSNTTGLAAGASENFGFNFDTSTTGTKTGTITIASSNAYNAPSTFSVSTTVLDQRTVAGGSVNFGKVLAGATVSGNAILSSAGAHDLFTDVNVAGAAAADANGIAASGSNTLFNGTTVSGNRTLSGAFSGSGAKSGSLALAVTSAENLAGEGTYAPVNVSYSADVYEPALLTANTASTSGALSVANAASTGQRAAARISDRTIMGGSAWSLSGLDAGTIIAAGDSKSASVTFNDSGKLNGQHKAKVRLRLEHDDQAIAGTSANDLGSYTWTIARSVSGNLGDGSATVLAGQSFAGFNTHRGSGHDTAVQFLGGSAGLNDRLVAVGFSDDPDPLVLSDTVAISGTASDLFVLQLSYDASISDSNPFLGWRNPGGQWINAVLGNSDGGASAQFVAGAYDGNATLGRFGVDSGNHVVWAVVDHNSDFAVVTVPEPGTAALMGIASLMLMRRRSRR